MAGPKNRCNNQWTESKFRSFVKGNLRQASMKWAPIQTALAKARTRRGFYHCAMCEQEVTATTKEERKRVKNVHVDHIHPVVDPEKGWEGWDILIERLFCEEDGLRVLCASCHKIVTDDEKQIAKERRLKEKQTDE